ncbi:HAD-IIIA family hydrolase [Psittacicella hinzii]|uniref:D,D-heptose 1,7-bisphosphate phosphatase n=1 Tax=Psittacicella hinzii TaxID=2028575 RepID=A0A3A1YTA7_9GAMM|nr:HAD-IIIA family hydrolase [Psittacicella hinzii]RIY40448.1 hypothetical protein CKF58_00590 [Psittacicella hinzii]
MEKLLPCHLTQILPHMLLAQKHLEQLPTDITVGNEQSYPVAQGFPLNGNTPVKAIFSDRDDTINDDGDGYLHVYQQMEILPQVYETLAQKQQQGYLIVIVTNQSGISRGKFSEQQFIQCMNDMAAHTYEQTGLVIDAVLFSPAADSNDPWRKPNTQTYQDLSKFFTIDLTKSYMIGDKPLDIQYGKNLNCQTILVARDLPKLLATSSVNAPEAIAVSTINEAQDLSLVCLDTTKINEQELTTLLPDLSSKPDYIVNLLAAMQLIK